MTPDDVTGLLKAEPFMPFLIRLSNGTIFTITSRDGDAIAHLIVRRCSW